MSRRGFLVVALVAALAAPAYGQRRGQGAGPQGANVISIEGNVEMVGASGILRMMSKQKQSVLVTMTPATKVQYTNKATPEFVRAGLAVEFTAEVEKKPHVVKEAVSQLTVISLSAERGLGLFPEGSSSASESKPGDKDKEGFAFGGGAIGGGGGDAAPATKPHKTPRKAPAVQLPGTCVVRGTIKSLRGGKAILNIGHGVLKADVADNVEVNVDMADLSFAKKGDSVSVTGVQGSGLMMSAESISIQGSEPLTGPKKKSLPPKKHASSKKDDSGDDAADSKPDKTSDKKKAADKDD